jgi:hypothetical protein
MLSVTVVTVTVVPRLARQTCVFVYLPVCGLQYLPVRAQVRLIVVDLMSCLTLMKMVAHGVIARQPVDCNMRQPGLIIVSAVSIRICKVPSGGKRRAEASAQNHAMGPR